MSGRRRRRERNGTSSALDGVGDVAEAGCELFGCGASMIAFLAVGLGYWWL